LSTRWSRKGGLGAQPLFNSGSFPFMICVRMCACGVFSVFWFFRRGVLLLVFWERQRAGANSTRTAVHRRRCWRTRRERERGSPDGTAKPGDAGRSLAALGCSSAGARARVRRSKRPHRFPPRMPRPTPQRMLPTPPAYSSLAPWSPGVALPFLFLLPSAPFRPPAAAPSFPDRKSSARIACLGNDTGKRRPAVSARLGSSRLVSSRLLSPAATPPAGGRAQGRAAPPPADARRQ